MVVSMNKQQYLEKTLGEKQFSPQKDSVKAFAPSNIALCKYWGKDNEELNIPVTGSLSISLTGMGTETALSIIDAKHDAIFLNQTQIDNNNSFAKRVIAFINLFRGDQQWRCRIDTKSDIPIAAGLASSASGFAALTLSLQQLFNWQHDLSTLSRVARLGSGSAARSLWNGFVLMQLKEDDAFATPINKKWPELRIGLLIAEEEQKPISSREAMQVTMNTSPFYKTWPDIVERDLTTIEEAIAQKDFILLGKTAEQNALAMHATMLTAQPSICYWKTSTIENMHKVWALRDQGHHIYFTEDAGPNLKLIFLAEDEEKVLAHWPVCQIIQPFTLPLQAVVNK